jgi:hypothetical protein
MDFHSSRISLKPYPSFLCTYNLFFLTFLNGQLIQINVKSVNIVNRFWSTFYMYLVVQSFLSSIQVEVISAQ